MAVGERRMIRWFITSQTFPLLLDVTPSTTICAGDGIWLEALAMGGEEGFVYYWPSLGTYGPTQYIAPTQSATYPVIATDMLW